MSAASFVVWASPVLALESASYRTLSAGFVASGGESSSTSYRSLGGVALGVGSGSSSSASYQLGAGIDLAVVSPRFRRLSVAFNGNGSGRVLVSSFSISCSQSCEALLALGSAVTLQAQVSAGSDFRGWGGDCAGTGACNLTMDGAKSVTATFVDTQFPRLTIASPGTITTVNQASYAVSGSCSESGRQVTVSVGSVVPVSGVATCSGGTYSVVGLDVSALPDGAVVITASHADAGGNVSSATATAQKFTLASIPVNSALANRTLSAGAQVFVTRGVLTLGPGLVIPPGADVLLVVGRGVSIAPPVLVAPNATLEIVIDPTLQQP